jgi:hypothetical protein
MTLFILCLENALIAPDFMHITTKRCSEARILSAQFSFIKLGYVFFSKR